MKFDIVSIRYEGGDLHIALRATAEQATRLQHEVMGRRIRDKMIGPALVVKVVSGNKNAKGK